MIKQFIEKKESEITSPFIQEKLKEFREIFPMFPPEQTKPYEYFMAYVIEEYSLKFSQSLLELSQLLGETLLKEIGELYIHDKEDDVSKYHWMSVGMNEERARIRNIVQSLSDKIKET